MSRKAALETLFHEATLRYFGKGFRSLEQGNRSNLRQGALNDKDN